MCSKSRKCSKSRRRSKSRKHSKSRRCSKSRAHSKHDAGKPGVWSSRRECSESKRRLKEEDKSCGMLSRVRSSPLLPSHSYEQLRSGRRAEHAVPSNREQLKYDKLKEEVVKQPHEYIRVRTTYCPYSGTQPCGSQMPIGIWWKCPEIRCRGAGYDRMGDTTLETPGALPVPPVPKWLCMPQMTQTTMPLRGELPLTPAGAHLRDIRIRSPALWAWMAVLLQFWQDHITQDLFGGRVCHANDLANTLIRNINPWLPHSAQFGWDYVATQAMLWLNIREQFTEEHFREWEAQKSQLCQFGTLKHDTEIVYHQHLTKRQAKLEAAESREAAAKQLPLERQAAHAERQAWAMPMKMDVLPVWLDSSLYPNGAWKQDTIPKGSDLPRPYKTPREDDRKALTLEEELDVKSVFDPLVSGSQSSQLLNFQSSTAPDTTTEMAGPKTPPHFCEAPVSILPFDLALIGNTGHDVTGDRRRKCPPEPGTGIPCEQYGSSRDRLWYQRVRAELLLWQPHVPGLPSHLFEHRHRPKDTGLRARNHQQKKTATRKRWMPQ